MFAKRLKDLRAREHITQEELALIIGVERSSVGKYESSKTEVIPSVDVLTRIADHFNVSIDYLLGRTNDPVDYDDGDLIDEIPGSILDAFGGDVKKAVEFQKQVDEDALNEKPPVILGAAAHFDPGKLSPDDLAVYKQLIEYFANKYKDE